MSLSIDKPRLDNLANEIWKSAERLRGKFKAYEYQNVVLPIIVIRRLECVLLKWREDKKAEIRARQPDISETKIDTYIRAHQLFDHGVVQMNTQNWEAAIADFEASNKLIAHHAQTYGNLGLCHAKLGNRQAALEAFDKALEIDPEYELALLNREIARTLDEGQSLEGKVKTVEYYRDYANGKRSYIEKFASDHHLLPDKR